MNHICMRVTLILTLVLSILSPAQARDILPDSATGIEQNIQNSNDYDQALDTIPNNTPTNQPLQSQEEAPPLSFVDLFLMGVFGYMIFRLLRRRNVPPNNQQPRTSRTVQDPESDKPPVEQYAQAMWDHLSSTPKEQEAPPHQADEAPTLANIPDDFDVENFLEGGRAVFIRLQESWAQRDLDDIQQFTTPGVLQQLTRQAASDPSPRSIAIQHLDARVVDVQQAEQESVTVLYQATLREGGGWSQSINIRETWTFTRDTTDPDATWVLAEIIPMQ